ncbi:MAG: YdbH domain-containing protein [Alphaproteobacteria bacterium]|nr:YdbH domain-containing protein [Alphaproteobacteria bacterium]
MFVPGPPSHHARGGKGKWPIVLGASVAALVGLCLLALLFAVPLATFFLHAYLSGQGVQSRITVDSIGLGGVTAHGSLGRPDAPELSFGRIAVTFDQNAWFPEISGVDIQRPTIRLAINGKGVSFGSLQPWIDAQRMKTAGAVGQPSFVSAGLVIEVANARILAATPAGPVEIDGSARLAGGKPQLIDAVVRRAQLRTGAASANIANGRLTGAATPSGMTLHLALSGSAALGEADRPLRFDGARLSFDVPDLHWTSGGGAFAVSAPNAALLLQAERQGRQGAPPAPLSVAVQFPNAQAVLAGGQIRSHGAAAVTAGGSLSPADAEALVSAAPLPAHSREAAALVKALGDLNLTMRLSWRTAGRDAAVTLDAPAQLRGAGGFQLSLTPLPEGTPLRFGPTEIAGGMAVRLSGHDVPNFDAAVPAFSWRRAGNRFDGTLGLTAQFDIGSFRGAAIDGTAVAQLRDGAFALRLQHCATVRLAAFTLRRKPVVSGVRAGVCAADGQPLFSASSTGWTFRALAREVSAKLDSAGMTAAGDVSQIAAGGTRHGLKDATMDIAATLSDATKACRLAPQSVTGTVQFAGKLLRGRFAVAAGPHRTRIGTVDLRHDMATGKGYAVLAFPDVAFASPGLQPVNLSPLLASIANAKGSAKFAGRFDWNRKHITSRGRLDVDDVQFSSPLGAAEKLRTHLIFASLLPPKTAPHQHIDIARVDWVSPLTKIETLISFDASQLRIENASTQFASGSISLAPLLFDLKPGETAKSTIHLSHVGMGTLIDASNLGRDIQLDGQISGDIPFSFGPEGLRFAHGHIEADGPGRLSINPRLWGQSQPNAVEKLAYRALQNLAFDSLSATIDSEPHGRLRIVFHIKGYDDGPGTRETQIGLFDLVQGTAFQKNIPLPRGTPIDLTLDTSLNFDELLRGYETAWSQVKAEGRQQQ